MGYALQIKYQTGVISQGRDNRAGLPLQIEYQEVDYPLLAEYQGCSPLQAKYKMMTFCPDGLLGKSNLQNLFVI